MNLRVSEIFYSVQAEGMSTGIPAIFIRLQNCNLICGGMNGKLQKASLATWTCDTIPVWKKGEEMSFDKIIEKIDAVLYTYNLTVDDTLCEGIVRVVWTGGEPMLQQQGIYEWLEKFYERFSTYPFSEIETNGTIVDAVDLYDDIHINQINCSPKLSNSGMPEKLRVNSDVIKQLVQLYILSCEFPGDATEVNFKFVINTEDDVKEIQETFVKPFKIPHEIIILMPGVDDRDDLADTLAFCYEMSKKYQYRTVTRGQVLAWNKVTGV